MKNKAKGSNKKRNSSRAVQCHVVTSNGHTTNGAGGTSTSSGTGGRVPFRVLLHVLVATSVWLVYFVANDASMLSGPFHLDAGPKIAENPDIRRVGAALMERHRSDSSLARRNDPSRPLASLSFQLNYYLSGGGNDGNYWNGIDPKPFRVTNFAIHALNAVLVGLLADLVMRAARLSCGSSSFSSPSSSPHRWTGLFPPVVSTALFAASPFNHHVAAYTYSRSDLLGAAGALLYAVLGLSRLVTAREEKGAEAEGRGKQHHCFSLPMAAALLFALFSREVTVVAPVALGLVHLVLLELPSQRGDSNGGTVSDGDYIYEMLLTVRRTTSALSRTVSMHLPSLAVIVTYLVFRLCYFGSVGGPSKLVRNNALDDPMGCYWRTQPYAWQRYGLTLLIPNKLAINHGIDENPFCKTGEAAASCFGMAWLFVVMFVRILQIAAPPKWQRQPPGWEQAAPHRKQRSGGAGGGVGGSRGAAAVASPVAGQVPPAEDRVTPVEVVALAMLGWYGINLLPSSVVRRSDVYVERRAYLAGAGVYIAFSIVILESTRRFLLSSLWERTASSFSLDDGKRRSFPSRWWPRHRHLHHLIVASIFAVLFVTCFVVECVTHRNRVFRSDESMWTDVVDQYPNSVRGLNNLSNAQMAKIRRQLADCARRGKHPCDYDKQLAEDIESNFSKLLKINRGDGYPMMALGNLHKELGDWDVAMTWWEKTVENYPRFAAAAHKAIGTAYHQEGKLDDALSHYKDAMSIDPLTMELHNNLALVYNSMGEKDLAKEVWQEGLNLFPNDRLLLENRNVIFRECDGAASDQPDFMRQSTTSTPSKDRHAGVESHGGGDRSSRREEKRWDFESAAASLLLSKHHPPRSREPRSASSCDPLNDYSCSPPLDGGDVYDAYGGSPPLDSGHDMQKDSYGGSPPLDSGDKVHNSYGGIPLLDGDNVHMSGFTFEADGGNDFFSRHEYGSDGVHGMGGNAADFNMTSASREGLLRLQQISTDMREDCVPGLLRGRTNDVDVRIAWTDDELRRFIAGYFTSRVVQALDGLKFPHRGYLWRYCWLFAVGGIYVDMKTVAVAPLAQTFDDLRSQGIPTWYMVWSNYSTQPHASIGVLATPAGNPFFLRLILHTVETVPSSLEDDSNMFSRQLLKEAEAEYGSITGPGEYYTNEWRLVVLEERCSADPQHEECKAQNGNLDRYGMCCNIYDADGNIRFHTQDSKYPWKECLSDEEAAKAEQSRQSDKASQTFDTALHHHKINNLPKAEEEYRKVLRLDPELTSDTYNNLALLLFNTGRTAEAREMWHRGWNLFPRNSLLTENKHIIFQEQ